MTQAGCRESGYIRWKCMEDGVSTRQWGMNGPSVSQSDRANVLYIFGKGALTLPI